MHSEGQPSHSRHSLESNCWPVGQQLERQDQQVIGIQRQPSPLSAIDQSQTDTYWDQSNHNDYQQQHDYQKQHSHDDESLQSSLHNYQTQHSNTQQQQPIQQPQHTHTSLELRLPELAIIGHGNSEYSRSRSNSNESHTSKAGAVEQDDGTSTLLRQAVAMDHLPNSTTSVSLGLVPPQQHLHGELESVKQPVSHPQAAPLQLEGSGPTTSRRSAFATKRRFACRDLSCDQTFSTSGHLSRHMKLHTGELPHVCPILYCQSMFSRRDNMIQHYVSHQRKLIVRNEIVHHKSDSAPVLSPGFDEKCKSRAKARAARKPKSVAALSLPLHIPSPTQDASLFVSGSGPGAPPSPELSLHDKPYKNSDNNPSSQHSQAIIKAAPNPRRTRVARAHQKPLSFNLNPKDRPRSSLSTDNNGLRTIIPYTYQLHNDPQLNSPLSAGRQYSNHNLFAQSIQRPSTVDPLEMSHYMAMSSQHDPNHQLVSPMAPQSSNDLSSMGALGRSASAGGMQHSSIHLPIPNYSHQGQYIQHGRQESVRYGSDFSGMLGTPQSLIHSMHTELDAQPPSRPLSADAFSSNSNSSLLLNHGETSLSVGDVNNNTHAPSSLSFLQRQQTHPYYVPSSIDSTSFIPHSLHSNIENDRNEYAGHQLPLPQTMQHQPYYPLYSHQPPHDPHYTSYDPHVHPTQPDFRNDSPQPRSDLVSSAYETNNHEQHPSSRTHSALSSSCMNEFLSPNSLHSLDAMHPPPHPLGISGASVCDTPPGQASATATELPNWLMYQQAGSMLTLDEQQHADMNIHHHSQAALVPAPLPKHYSHIRGSLDDVGGLHVGGSTSLLTRNCSAGPQPSSSMHMPIN
ncbi:hypothetical protein BASA50_002676 [Batrachochytrium salamandrivorans]|uniref:C2H2-type domain-containing protein n=1 Tax=Batrachochytrium salamandrivorans TaxID=1357716 RepID=A0ABQ8FLY1_9FUNG|nr:hypothetical protein BASA50_002676 [Batrachochytrium salamandrivorans]